MQQHCKSIAIQVYHVCSEAASYRTGDVHNIIRIQQRTVLYCICCRTVRIRYIAKLKQATRSNWILNMLNSEQLQCINVAVMEYISVVFVKHLRGERKTARPAVQRSTVFVMSFHMTSSATFNWMRSYQEKQRLEMCNFRKNPETRRGCSCKRDRLTWGRL